MASSGVQCIGGGRGCLPPSAGRFCTIVFCSSGRWKQAPLPDRTVPTFWHARGKRHVTLSVSTLNLFDLLNSTATLPHSTITRRNLIVATIHYPAQPPAQPSAPAFANPRHFRWCNPITVRALALGMAAEH
jgi:hypothetical protein